MFADAFIHFLLERSLLTDRQAKEVLAKKIPKVRPSVIAVYDGLITEEQAKEIAALQASLDMPFSFLAVREGFLTNEQASGLMGRNTRDDMRVMQALSDKGFMSMNGVMDGLKLFREHYGVCGEGYDELVENRVESYVCHIGGIEDENDLFGKYASVFISTFLRCIDGSVRIGRARREKEIRGEYVVRGACDGDVGLTFGIAFDDEKSALNLAGRFVKQRRREYCEYVEDSIKEFINIAAGLFVTLLEKDLNITEELNIPEIYPGGIHTSDEISVMDIYSSDCRARIFLSNNN